MKKKILSLFLALLMILGLLPSIVQADSSPLPPELASPDSEDPAEPEPDAEPATDTEESAERQLGEPFTYTYDDPEEVTDEDQLVYYFYKIGCPYCDEISALLASLPDEVPTYDGETTKLKLVGLDKNFVPHREIIERYYEDRETAEDRRYVPMAVIGDRELFVGDEIVPELLTALFNGEGRGTDRAYLPHKPVLTYLYDEICAACDGEENWREAVAVYLNLNLTDNYKVQFMNRRTEREAAEALTERLTGPVERYPLVILDDTVLLSGEEAIAAELVPTLLEHQAREVLPIVITETEPSELLYEELTARIREKQLKPVLELVDLASEKGKVRYAELAAEADTAPEGVPAMLQDQEWIVGVTKILEALDAK